MDSSQAESLPLSLSKHPEVGWEEGKSTLAYEPGQFTPVYVATMKDKHQAGGRADAASRPCCGQFDDPAAIEQQLPIASGQIESSHRRLIQKRLKSRGPAGNWSMQTPCSLPGLPGKINDGRTTDSSIHRMSESLTFTCTRGNPALVISRFQKRHNLVSFFLGDLPAVAHRGLSCLLV